MSKAIYGLFDNRKVSKAAARKLQKSHVSVELGTALTERVERVF